MVYGLVAVLIGFYCGYRARFSGVKTTRVPTTHLKYLLIMHKQYEKMLYELISGVEENDTRKIKRLYRICKKIVEGNSNA